MPSTIIDVADIRDVVNDFNNKAGHMLIRLDRQDLHLKSDEVEVKNKFVESVQYMREIFSVKQSTRKEQKTKNRVDDEIKLEILAENDVSDWARIQVGIT